MKILRESSSLNIREDEGKTSSPYRTKDYSRRSASSRSESVISRSPSPRSRKRSRRSRSRRRKRRRSRSYSSRRSSRSYSSYSRRRGSRSYSRRRSRSYSYSRSRSRARTRSRRHPKSHRPAMPSRCLGVFGLHPRTDEKELQDFFSPYGEIEKVVMVNNRVTGHSRGFGFVYFRDEESARDAKDGTLGARIDGREIRIDFSYTIKE